MQYVWESAILAAMFAVRLGVPLAIIFLVSHVLLRLDARWRADALAHQQSHTNGTPCTGPDDAAFVHRDGALIQEPCWEYRGCSEVMRANCPAYGAPQLSCWLARRMAHGRLPSQCAACSIFTTARRLGTRPAELVH